MIKKILIGTVMSSVVSMSLYASTIDWDIYDKVRGPFNDKTNGYSNVQTVLDFINDKCNNQNPKDGLRLSSDNSKVLRGEVEWQAKSNENLYDSYKQYEALLSFAGKRWVYEALKFKINEDAVKDVLAKAERSAVKNAIYLGLALNKDYKKGSFGEALADQIE